ncbi:MAG: hypothetical protein GY750_03795 [Lentisphaerae bacterium]|nr:hypothetical protein [Lentisphaerota bacterium]
MSITTTELIKLLKIVEFGASGRPRAISFNFPTDNDPKGFIHEPDIKITSTGDGCAGAELTLRIIKVQTKI